MVDYNRDNTLPRDIVDEMRESYLNYSNYCSVIIRKLRTLENTMKIMNNRSTHNGT